MRLPTSLLAHNLANPCLGCEPKARVATSINNELFLSGYGKLFRNFRMNILITIPYIL